MPYAGERPEEAVGYSIKELIFNGSISVSATDLLTDLKALKLKLKEDPNYLVGTPYTREGIERGIEFVIAREQGALDEREKFRSVAKGMLESLQHCRGSFVDNLSLDCWD